MGLAEVQSALARLFTDEALRSRFFADPATVGGGLGLDASEVADLSGLSRTHVSQFAATLRRKRVEDARKYLPLTSRALGDSFASHLLAAIDGPAPPGRHRDDARRLVEHLAGVDDPPWIHDLGRYELAFREASGRGPMLFVRVFRYPVGRLAASVRDGTIPVIEGRRTIGVWFRVSGRGGLFHRAW